MKFEILICLVTGFAIFCGPTSLKSATVMTAAGGSAVAHVSVENSLDQTRTDTLVRLPGELLDPPGAEQIRDLVIYDEDIPLPTQPLDSDGDGELDSLVTVVDLGPDERKSLKVAVNASLARATPWPKRTQAEISRKVGGSWNEGIYKGGHFMNTDFVSFKGQLPDHNYFLRYEGPGWESDKVGYRLYLDHRNGIDVFGKQISAMVLQDVGTDGYESYHEPEAWGMDVLKVGSSLGMGGFGAWSEEQAHRVAVTDRTRARVLANGPVVSQLRVDYEGWETPEGKADLTVLLSIEAGSVLTEASLTLNGARCEMVTGIPKHPEVEWLRGETDDIPNEAWTYLAAYGPQSLSGDKLGLVIFVRKEAFAGFFEDDHNQLIRLKLHNGQGSYHFGAVWESRTDAAASLEDFNHWIESTQRRLNREPRVSIQAGNPAAGGKGFLIP